MYYNLEAPCGSLVWAWPESLPRSANSQATPRFAVTKTAVLVGLGINAFDCYLYSSNSSPIKLSAVFKLCRHKIREQLSKGVSLVVDRYAYSGVAFTAAKRVSEAAMEPAISIGDHLP